MFLASGRVFARSRSLTDVAISCFGGPSAAVASTQYTEAYLVLLGSAGMCVFGEGGGGGEVDQWLGWSGGW